MNRARAGRLERWCLFFRPLDRLDSRAEKHKSVWGSGIRPTLAPGIVGVAPSSLPLGGQPPDKRRPPDERSSLIDCSPPDVSCQGANASSAEDGAMAPTVRSPIRVVTGSTLDPVSTLNMEVKA